MRRPLKRALLEGGVLAAALAFATWSLIGLGFYTAAVLVPIDVGIVGGFALGWTYGRRSGLEQVDEVLGEVLIEDLRAQSQLERIREAAPWN